MKMKGYNHYPNFRDNIKYVEPSTMPQIDKDDFWDEDEENENVDGQLIYVKPRSIREEFIVDFRLPKNTLEKFVINKKRD